MIKQKLCFYSLQFLKTSTNDQKLTVVSFIYLKLIFIKANLVSKVRKLASSKPMAFADFSGLEVFRLLMILWLFDNFLTNLLLPPLPSILSYLTAILVALDDESVNQLALSIEVSGVGGNSVNLTAFDKHLNVSIIWLDTTYPKKRIFFCQN